MCHCTFGWDRRVDEPRWVAGGGNVRCIFAAPYLSGGTQISHASIVYTCDSVCNLCMYVTEYSV